MKQRGLARKEERQHIPSAKGDVKLGQVHSAYVDISLEVPGIGKVYVQTVTTLPDGITPTATESLAATRIATNTGGLPVIMIPKGTAPADAMNIIKSKLESLKK